MTKTLLKISAVCAACSMFSVSGWAQANSQDNSANDQNKPANSMNSDQNTQSWSTKHLSATGRMHDHAVRASKLTGATVNDSSGQRLGTIQDFIVNPTSGRIDFALLSLSNQGSSTANTSENTGNTSENTTANYSANGKVVPVPWSLLRTSASSEYSASSGQPTFTLNADRSKLESAPNVDLSDLSQSEWQQRVYSYYGVTPRTSMGGAESPSGEIKGEGARSLQQQNSTPESQQDQQQQPQSNP
jgi:sporulation protein YlmC with PRC-barrel domain